MWYNTYCNVALVSDPGQFRISCSILGGDLASIDLPIGASFI